MVPDLKGSGAEPRPADLEARSLGRPIFLLALTCLLTLGLLFWRECRVSSPSRRHQERYQALVGGTGAPAAGLGPLEVGGRVERCPSCHVGIAERPRRRALPNPYRAHPGRLLLDHPPHRFGCSSCHGAGGERVDRCVPARGDPDGRALGAARAQASCLRCHEEPDALPGAGRLAAGLRAYRRLGCGGCHQVRGLDGGRRIGPPLDGVARKLPQAYLRAFLSDPQRLRPGTAMPSFFSEDALRGAPGFRAGLTRARRQSQLDDLLAFLDSSPPSTLLGSGGDAMATAVRTPAAGLQLMRKLGCVACHLAADPAAERWRMAGLGGVGPDLGGSARRLSREWLLAWLDSPQKLWPETRMPDFRLSAAERANLAAALSGPTRWPLPPQPPSAAVRRGRQLAEELGCGGCHSSRALPAAPPGGPALDGIGDKRLDLLDWGHSAVPARERSVWRWMRLKLEEPLHFDRRPGVLVMPWQKLRPGELESLLLLMRALSADRSGPLARAPLATVEARRGERLFEELACRQCHRIGDRGGALAALFPIPADAPPSLAGQGGKVRPAWLYRFLGRPLALRPWLAPRMPTPAASAAERQSMTAALAVREGASYPFTDEVPPRLEGRRLEDGLRLFAKLQCLRCHLLSNAGVLKPGELSPDLALGADRLRRAWIRRFILDPQRVLPGTKMPSLFPLLDEDDPRSRSTPQPEMLGGSVAKQVELLTDLSLWWGSAEAARRATQPTRGR